MTNKYNALVGKVEVVVYGPCCAMMRTDLEGNVLYCNINKGEQAYIRMQKEAKKALNM